MRSTAVQTTRKPNAAVQAKPLPPARTFAKQPGAAGRKLVRLGEAKSRVASAPFAVPREFRSPRRSDYFTPTAAPVFRVGLRSVAEVEPHPRSFPDRETALEAVSRHLHTPPAAVIQLAQLPAAHVAVPPALPLHRSI